MNKISLISLSILLILNGCVNEPVNDTESVLMDLLDRDEVIGVDGFGTEGDADLDHEFGLETDGISKILSDTLSFGEDYKIRFGRQITSHDRTVEFDINGDTAIAQITYTIFGEFIVKAMDTASHQPIDSLSFSKEFSTIFSRKVKFVNIDAGNGSSDTTWRISGLTPMVGGSGDKVSILSLVIYSLTDSLDQGELLYSFESDGMSELFIDRESIPTFTAFSRYQVEVTVDNLGPELTADSAGVGEWVLKNYGRSSRARGRRYLNDRGTFLDATMNDNIHTGGWRTHGPGFGRRPRGFKSFVETIDLATIFVEDGGYNTAVWSIPYRIERP